MKDEAMTADAPEQQPEIVEDVSALPAQEAPSVPACDGADAAVQRLTKEQAAIIGAFTGYLAGPFSDMHGYIEKLMGRPVFTHELASKDLSEELKRRAKPDFLRIVHEPAQ